MRSVGLTLKWSFWTWNGFRQIPWVIVGEYLLVLCPCQQIAAGVITVILLAGTSHTQQNLLPSLVRLVAVTLIVAGPPTVADPVEIGNPLGFATSITNANNGDILLMKGKRMLRSSDGGRTFSEPVTMSIGVSGMSRLDEEHLIARSGRTFHVSADDGASWETRGQIDASSAQVQGAEGEYPGWVGLGVPNYDVLLKGSDDRLFLPVRGSAAASRLLASQSEAQGIFRGKLGNVKGHAHRPEADYSFNYVSEDGGQTWRRSHGSIVIWKDEGYGGIWPADEPCMVELSNGELMMFFRTTLGRVYTSRSGPVDSAIRGGP